MCWCDKVVMDNMIKLRDEFNIKLFVETGSWVGINTEYLGRHFPHVLSCDIVPENVQLARQRTEHQPHVTIRYQSSDEMIADIPDIITTLFFLDAHEYRGGETNGCVVQEELIAMGRRDNAFIVIHDYDNGELGNIKIGWDEVGMLLDRVNPHFHYYTNTKEMCDIVSPDNIHLRGIPVDDFVKQTFSDIASGGDATKYRGVLYAVPYELDLNKYRLVEYKP